MKVQAVLDVYCNKGCSDLENPWSVQKPPHDQLIHLPLRNNFKKSKRHYFEYG